VCHLICRVCNCDSAYIINELFLFIHSFSGGALNTIDDLNTVDDSLKLHDPQKGPSRFLNEGRTCMCVTKSGLASVIAFSCLRLLSCVFFNVVWFSLFVH